jgi:hypothetical protein
MMTLSTAFGLGNSYHPASQVFSYAQLGFSKEISSSTVKASFSPLKLVYTVLHPSSFLAHLPL